MIQWLSEFLDDASEYLAPRKGLLPFIGMALILVNFLLACFLPADWFIIRTNLFLHLGLIVAIFGGMMAWAL